MSSEVPVSNKVEVLSASVETRSLFPKAENYECGAILGQRITGGKDAAKGKWPWIALLYYDGTYNQS
jgi:hypothetical protein